MKGWKGTEDGYFPPFLIIDFHMFEFFWKAFSCSESIDGGTINIIIIMHMVIIVYRGVRVLYTGCSCWDVWNSLRLSCQVYTTMESRNRWAVQLLPLCSEVRWKWNVALYQLEDVLIQSIHYMKACKIGFFFVCVCCFYLNVYKCVRVCICSLNRRWYRALLFIEFFFLSFCILH